MKRARRLRQKAHKLLKRGAPLMIQDKKDIPPDQQPPINKDKKAAPSREQLIEELCRTLDSDGDGHLNMGELESFARINQYTGSDTERAQ